MRHGGHLLTLFPLCVVLLCLAGGFASRAAGTGIEVVATLDLADQGSRWLSTSVYGGVYSFLSEKVFWWGSLNGANINLYPARIPTEFQPHLALSNDLGYDTRTGHYFVDLYAYSNVTSTVSFVEFDLSAQEWIVNSQVVVPVRDYQYLIADSSDLQTRSSLFLISLDYIVYIDLDTFTIVAQMDLSQQFVTQYPVNLVAGATFHQGNLFIARTGSLGGQTLAQIVDVRVFNTHFQSLQFDHVVYLDAACDNMFGWGDYLFWPQLHGNNGTLYGWGLDRRNLLFTSVGLGPGAIWGKGVGANQKTNQALLVSGNPAGGGYTAWVAIHDDQRVQFVDSRPMPGGRLPSMGIQTVSSDVEDPCLSVLLAGHNAAGFGQVTWLRYAPSTFPPTGSSNCGTGSSSFPVVVAMQSD